MSTRFNQTLYYFVISVMVISGIALGIYYFAKGDTSRLYMGLISFLFLLIPYALHKARIRVPHRFMALFFIFIILAYNIGFIMSGYHRFSFYDKFVHFVSGFTFFIVGMGIASYLQTYKRVNWRLDVLFALFFSMFIALLNEFIECGAYLLTGDDPQHTLDTGVMDTMGDLTACLVSSIICLLLYALFFHKRFQLFKHPIITEFEELNK